MFKPEDAVFVEQCSYLFASPQCGRRSEGMRHLGNRCMTWHVIAYRGGFRKTVTKLARPEAKKKRSSSAPEFRTRTSSLYRIKFETSLLAELDCWKLWHATVTSQGCCRVACPLNFVHIRLVRDTSLLPTLATNKPITCLSNLSRTVFKWKNWMHILYKPHASSPTPT